MTMPASPSTSLSPWKTPRGRFLATLAGLTVVLVIAAALALTGERARTAVQFAPRPFFPALESRLDAAAQITLTSRDASITMKRGADKTWTATSMHDYPVDGKRIRVLLLGLTNLVAVEQKTAQPALHEALGLGAPDAQGSGTLVTVSDADGAVIASLIAGKQAPGAMEGQDHFYARRVGEDQTYVVKGSLVRSVDVVDWLETTIVDIPRDRVQSVAVHPLDGPDYRVSRASASDANFVVEGIPKGRVVLNETVANATGAALSDLTLDDVRKADELDFSKAGGDVYQTFDGLTLTLDVIDADGAFWLRVKAEGNGDSASAEAAAINARTAGWAYKLSEWKGEILLRALERLLQSSDAATPKSDDLDLSP